MHGREHLVGITAHKKGLVLVILRYADELRKAEPYFDKIDTTPKADAVQLAVELIEEHSGKFEPQKMPNEYAEAIHELVQAKVEERAPAIEIETQNVNRRRSSTSWMHSRRVCKQRGRLRSERRFASAWAKSPHLKSWLGHQRVASRQRAQDGRCIEAWYRVQAGTVMRLFVVVLALAVTASTQAFAFGSHGRTR